MRARAAVPVWMAGRRPPALDLGPGETVARIGRAMHIAASSSSRSSKAIVSLLAVA